MGSTEDAQFLIRVVRDAERWNTHGLSEADMAVSFEMSPLCNWGDHGGERGFSDKRFRAALRELATSPLVRKAAGRWYWHESRGLRAITEATWDGKRQVKRTCARELCGAELTRPNAVYCSRRCRDRDYRYGREAASQNRTQKVLVKAS
jgi:hypothetical protein